jgi:hypothetical protein
VRPILVALLLPLAVGCGGDGGSRSGPTAPTTPVAPSEWTLSGQVVTTLGAQPVAGATVSAAELSATTDATGRFEFRRATALAGPIAVSVSAGGMLTRQTHLASPRSTPLTVDVIADRAPFDLAFYRQLVRNGLEQPEQLAMLHRWTRDATFYLLTLDASGRRVEPEVLAMIRRELPAAFAYWTDGHYRATVEEGTEERPAQVGLVRVTFERSSDGACALATVGGNDGVMQFNLDRCGCGSVKVTPNVVWHEVGHTAGFWHVAGDHMMNRYYNEYCGSVIHQCETERWHARIAYTRPFGNLDPDHDPESFSLIEAGLGTRPTVTCP